MLAETSVPVRFGRSRRISPSRICMIPPAQITLSPHRPRRTADADSLAALADSIRRHGIIEPVSVRETEDGRYELIAGERRLCAANLLGLSEIPCVILEADGHFSAAAALIGNLRRENLNMFEQAAAMDSLLRGYALTQEEVAEQLCVSQSFVANKLRLLRYLPDERDLILEAALTERHARALLRLCGDDRLSALREVIARRLNVAETESFVDALLRAPADSSSEIRALCRAVEQAADLARRAGQNVICDRSQSPTEIRIVIRIPAKDADCFT